MLRLRLNLKNLNAVLLCCVVMACGWMLISFASPTHAQDSPSPADPGYSWDGTYRRVRVPILAYQAIAPEMFRQHIDTLFYQGYTPISLNDLDRALLTGERLPAEPVILTFDGGRRDAYEQAFPILQSRGFTATFFVVTGLADHADPGALTWDQIAEMSAAGMHMESNGKTAPDLRGGTYDFLVYELLGSAQSLEAYTGVAPYMFAYPGGNYDDSVIDLLRSMNVMRAVTLRNGVYHTSDNRYEMARRTVTEQTDVNGLLALLRENP